MDSPAVAPLVPRWVYVAFFILLAIVVTSIFTDSIVVILVLNRVVRLQNDVCSIHKQVHAWELIAARQLKIQQPLLSSGCP
jgi:hypothetical protein